MANNIATGLFGIKDNDQNQKVYDPAVTRGDLVMYDEGISLAYQPINIALSSISALSNSAGVLTNDGAGNLSWSPGGGGGGISTIGTLNSVAKSANGAVISGTDLVMQTADATNPGLVSTGTQTIAGNKTITGESATVGNVLVVQNLTPTAKLTVANAGRVTVGQDSTVTTEVCAVITTDVTNANLVLAPNGTGAIIANIPDGTAAGGNARGNNAVDLQTSGRAAPTQIASGPNSVIGGGFRNTASGGNLSTVCGGGNNTSSNFNTFVGGGNTNSATADSATVTGGLSNTASGSYSFVGGGQSNTSTVQYATISGGQSNSITGFGFGAISGGSSNSITANRGFIGGGGSNTVSNQFGVISGGSANVITGDYGSISGGFYAGSYLYGQRANSSGAFNFTYDAQTSALTYRRAITGTAITELFLDGASIRAILALPTGATNARMWTAMIQISAIVATQGAGTALQNECFSGTYQCAIKRVLTTTSMIGNVTPTSELSDTNMVTSVVTISADDTNEALKIEFTPPTTAAADTVIRVVATAYLTEVGR